MPYEVITVEPAMRPADVNGHRGWYAETGRGPPLVLLASPFALARSYRRPAGELARSFRVVTAEMPGSGKADRLREKWGVAEYAGWAAGLLDHLGVGDVTLVGHSLAGAIAVAVAADHPARVGRVVLAGATGAVTPYPFWKAFLGRVVDAAQEPGLAAAYGWHLAYNCAVHFRNQVRITRVSLAEDALGYAARVRVPALVAWGRRDHIVPPRCAEVFARHLADPTVYWCETGAHEWPVEYPAEFARAVAGFVGRAKGEPRA